MAPSGRVGLIPCPPSTGRTQAPQQAFRQDSMQKEKVSRPRHYGRLWTRMRESWHCFKAVFWQGSHSTAFTTCHATRMDSEIFRTMLLHRLQVLLPLNAGVCPCGRFLDCLGRRRSACAVSGTLGRRGFAVEVAVARIFPEGGASASPTWWSETWICQVPGVDGRRLEVVTEGLSLFRGAQLAIDSTLVSTLRGDGTGRAGTE